VVDYKQVPGTSALKLVRFPMRVNDKRPLAGIKILELGRVIALPAAGALLAALGADVIAIQSPNLANIGVTVRDAQDGRASY
jgi:crotonobetainyl-CoA:carnitine CoA-transferase CaiB-like acyl-CoA transferase